ncbi:hypothetical protein B0H17DRAFT_1262224 [Mycena rosella]|uniref:Uncharacterized protein n=1 Tax=Mycena rosella TaxID=1033263 RepID=A0AAD7DSE4_MYCRO|nr:hypothetical protein B0H17DRAFT_1262224 [Mycena rosella]
MSQTKGPDRGFNVQRCYKPAKTVPTTTRYLRSHPSRLSPSTPPRTVSNVTAFYLTLSDAPPRHSACTRTAAVFDTPRAWRHACTHTCVGRIRGRLGRTRMRRTRAHVCIRGRLRPYPRKTTPAAASEEEDSGGARGGKRFRSRMLRRTHARIGGDFRATTRERAEAHANANATHARTPLGTSRTRPYARRTTPTRPLGAEADAKRRTHLNESATAYARTVLRTSRTARERTEADATVSEEDNRVVAGVWPRTLDELVSISWRALGRTNPMGREWKGGFDGAGAGERVASSYRGHDEMRDVRVRVWCAPIQGGPLAQHESPGGGQRVYADSYAYRRTSVPRGHAYLCSPEPCSIPAGERDPEREVVFVETTRSEEAGPADRTNGQDEPITHRVSIRNAGGGFEKRIRNRSQRREGERWPETSSLAQGRLQPDDSARLPLGFVKIQEATAQLAHRLPCQMAVNELSTLRDARTHSSLLTTMDPPCITANPDISGIGVRTAIYAQNLLCFIPVVAYLWDGTVSPDEMKGIKDQSIGMLAIAFAILISTIIQATTAIEALQITSNCVKMNNIHYPPPAMVEIRLCHPHADVRTWVIPENLVTRVHGD